MFHVQMDDVDNSKEKLIKRKKLFVFELMQTYIYDPVTYKHYGNAYSRLLN